MKMSNFGRRGESHNYVVKIVIVLIALFLVVTLLRNAWQSVADTTTVNSPSSVLKNTKCDVASLTWQIDSDGDGVPDSCDVCYGASEIDGDNDGIPDACDMFPDIPGDFSGDCKRIISINKTICGPEP